MSPRRNPSPTQLGNHIIRQRKKKDWNTADLAREAGLPYGTVRNVEKGYSHKPAEVILRALSKALEIDEGVVFAYAGYGELPVPKGAPLDPIFDSLGEDAPEWRNTIERIKHEMTPDEQRHALIVLRAQLDAASRHWRDRR